MSEQIPDDTGVRRVWLIVGVLFLVAVLVAIGVSLALLAARTPANKAPSFTPAEETSASVSPSSSSPVSAQDSSPSTTSTTKNDDSTTSTTTSSGQIVRAALVAYRQNDRIWVANENGTGAKAVVSSRAGAFSLSPDGRTLVVVRGPNPATDHAVLVDVATGEQAQLPLAVDLPAWAPDSSWLAYTGGSASVGYSVRRVNRDGSHDALLVASGAQPKISADGKRVAYTGHPYASAADPLRVMDISSRAVLTVPNAQGALHFAWSSGGVLFFAKDAAGSSPGWLGMTSGTMKNSSAVATLPAGSSVAPGQPYPSPDGSKVLLAMVGDDGYSQMFMANVAAKKATSLSTRHDAYPVQWLLDGSGLLYIEGNIIQKEASSLNRMNVDGSNRKTLVSGATL